MFAVSGDHAIPGLSGPLAIPRDAAGIVVITVRRLERTEAMVALGTHVMSPSHLPGGAELAATVALLLRADSEERAARHPRVDALLAAGAVEKKVRRRR